MMEAPSTAPKIAKNTVKGSSGASRPAGKTDSCDEALRAGKQPVASEVTTLPVEGDKNIATKIAQSNMDGNPKKRTEAVWGGPTVKGSGDFQQK
jgi:hypothetical protein